MAKQLTKNDVRELFMDVINVDLKAAVDPITYRPKHICTSPTGLCCDPKAEDFCSYAERKRR